MKKILKYGLIALVAIIVLGLLFGGGDDKPNTQTTNNEPETQEVQVVDVDTESFVAEFDKNQLAAETKYEDTYIRATGYVGNISEDILGSYYIILNPTSEEHYFGTSIQCYFEDKEALTAIENGQEVTVVGRVDSQSMNVLVKDCVLE